MPRIWDRFLTEQDRVLDATLPRVAASDGGPGRSPALLLIDLYRCVFGASCEPLLEAIERDPLNCGPAGWRSLPFIRELLGSAREVGIPVIHLTHSEAVPEPWARLRYRGLPLTSAENAREHDRWRILDDLTPAIDEIVLEKSSPSGFQTTPLAAVLHELKVDTLVVAGESTSGCVRATVVDGSTNRFKMMIVEDCVFDRTEASHAIGLYDMHRKYGDVVPLREAIEYLHGNH